MERAYATSPTPTVNGDEANFRKYLGDGGNESAKDLEKGMCIATPWLSPSGEPNKNISHEPCRRKESTRGQEVGNLPLDSLS